MLHETAVSWMRLRLASSVPKQAWLETRQAFAARLKACCEDVNKHLDVEGLCRELPSRVQQLVDAKGGRLKQ